MKKVLLQLLNLYLLQSIMPWVKKKSLQSCSSTATKAHNMSPTTFFVTTKSYGIIPSVSGQRKPYDSSLAQNFFSILKSERINSVKIAGYEQVRLLISAHINYYNRYKNLYKTKLTPLKKTKSVCCLV